jgi:hypothetical protein
VSDQDLAFGGNVRVRSTPETEQAGVAGRAGSIYRFTTPSVTGVSVIEKLTSDYALNVFFDDLRKEFWFAPELIELIDYGAGATITFDGVPKNMGAHGGGRLG